MHVCVCVCVCVSVMSTLAKEATHGYVSIKLYDLTLSKEECQDTSNVIRTPSISYSSYCLLCRVWRQAGFIFNVYVFPCPVPF